MTMMKNVDQKLGWSGDQSDLMIMMKNFDQKLEWSGDQSDLMIPSIKVVYIIFIESRSNGLVRPTIISFQVFLKSVSA